MQNGTNSIKRTYVTAAGWFLGIVAGGLLTTVLALVALEVAARGGRGVPVPTATALVGTAAGVAAAGVAWLVLGALLEAGARTPGAVGRAAARLSAAVSPRVVRRAASILLGVGMSAGLAHDAGAAVRSAAVGVPQVAVSVAERAGPGSARLLPAAGADPRGATPDPGWRAVPVGVAPDPGWTPQAPVVRPQADVSVLTGASRQRADPAETVVVRRGDSLWSIVAARLGPGATDAEVAAEWPRWYAANRAVIGPDPDLILAGQVLRVPAEVAQ